MDKLIERLIGRGMEVSYRTEVDWTAPPPRESKQTDDIQSIFVPLTPVEWCAMCMREGDSYIGGCCGVTDRVQGVLNDIFLDGGWVDAATAFDLIEAGGSHEGFEALTEKDESKLLEQEARWNELSAFEKVMLCVGAVKGKMPAGMIGMPSRFAFDTLLNPKDPKAVIDALASSSSYLRYKDLFASTDESPDVRSGQRHGNVALTIARCVPAARAFLDIAHQIEKMPFEGFAIVDDHNKVQLNGYGLCLYRNQTDAEDMLESWRKRNAADPPDRRSDLSKTIVKPCRVTLEGGLEI